MSAETPSVREQHERIMEAIKTRGLPWGETEWRDREYRQWSVWLARVVECPDCAFTFGADHEDDTLEGGYSCPVCELAAAAVGVGGDAEAET